MRIALFHHGFGAEGGYTRDYTELARRLQTHHTIEVISLVPGADAYSMSFLDGFRVHEFGFRSSLAGVGRLRAISRASHFLASHRDDFDLYFGTGWWQAANHVLARLALRLGLASVIAPLDSLNPYAIDRGRKRIPKRVGGALIRAYHGSRRPTLQVYAPIDAGFASQVGIHWPYFVAPLGISDDYETPSASLDRVRILGDADGRRILFFNARLDVYRKGIDLLIEGYRMARASRDEWRTLLVVSGKDPRRHLAGQIDTVAEMVRPLVESGDAAWLGFQPADDRRDLLAFSDMFIYPSRHDGPPRPIREALSRGTPVSTTEETGMGHWVDEYGAGISIKPLSVAGVRDAILQFEDLSDEELLVMRESAKRLAERLRWDTCWRDYERGLSDALDRSHRL